MFLSNSPLVLNVTNSVAVNFAANALLAIGASPVMSSAPEEMEDLTAACGALCINIGTLDKAQVEAMCIAAAAACRLGKPWVLDPVGVGASRFRLETARMLVEEYQPDVIRGNPSEIITLAGGKPEGRGVDSECVSETALEFAKSLSISTGSVVSVSGAVDFIVDGDEVESVAYGHPMMAKVTAMGCVASSVTAAMLAVDKDSYSAAITAMKLMGFAGQRAAAISSGPGTLMSAFLDELYRISPENIR